MNQERLRDKREVLFDDVCLDGEPVDLAYIDFEPVPLLPTYSFAYKGAELRYGLTENIKVNKGVDRQNIYSLRRIYQPSSLTGGLN